MERAIRLGRAGKDRGLLAFADQFGGAFVDRFTAEEWGQLDGLLESAQMAVDLEEWSASRKASSIAETKNAQPANATLEAESAAR